MVSRISSQKANPTHPVETLATRYVEFDGKYAGAARQEMRARTLPRKGKLASDSAKYLAKPPSLAESCNTVSDLS